MNASGHHSTKVLDELKNKAKTLGFSRVGITDTDVSAHSPHLTRWLDDGFEGSMEWFHQNLELRHDPKKLVPGTQRVISVALDYLPPNTNCIRILNDPEKAYISRYALGRDYHKLLRKRLKKLATWFREAIAPHGFRVFTDSAPILEKHLAEKAGLGWIGKHTLLLSRQAGSWFFLGEIFTDYPLPLSNNPETSRCGSCTACLDVCPTNAFAGPFRLDAKKCISYLTIEHKGVIDESLRAAIGNRVFGCDDCQLVCPWNRYANVGDPEFQPRHNLENVQLMDLFQWDEQKFLTSTEGSPIRRAGYIKFLENLAIGLGNGGAREEVVAALSARLGKHGDTLDTHIQWALERLSLQATENEYGNI
jgi:epoxyqueuosine reductase|tara:strand:- start:21857 stop:22945 length:1089 start_codon:yes stop_codon:yes gene_type:complete